MKRFAVLCLGLYGAAGWASEQVVELRKDQNLMLTSAEDTRDFGLDGPALDLAASRDSEGFKRNTLRVGAMVQYASPYDFIALGASRNEFSQAGWARGVNSLVLSGRNVNRRTAEGYVGRFALTTNTDKIQWHGTLAWNKRFDEKAGMELIFNRDAVETRAALEQGTLVNLYAASFDYALNDRWTAIAMPTYRDFTDGNDQKGGRGWLIYGLLPEQGLSAELKGQFYDSARISPDYFSPDTYRRAELGLRLRRAIGDWRVFAEAAYGREFINNDIEQPTTVVNFTGQRSFSNQLSVGVQLSYYRAAANGAGVNAADDYHWSMVRAYMTIPLN